MAKNFELDMNYNKNDFLTFSTFEMVKKELNNTQVGSTFVNTSRGSIQQANNPRFVRQDGDFCV